MSKETIAHIGHFSDCPLAKQPKIEEKWEKEFWKQFVNSNGTQELRGQAVEMLIFIRQLLQEQQTEIAEEVEKMRKSELFGAFQIPVEENRGFNQALDKILKLLTNQKNDNNYSKRT